MVDKVASWIPVTPRSDGSLRRWRKGKDKPSMIIGWLGVGPNGEIGVSLEDAKPGDIVAVKPFKFIAGGTSAIYNGKLLYELCWEDIR